MPALPTNFALNTLVDRDLSTNITRGALEVVCAWPVSGQYGPGSRILYYVLVLACLLARKVEWAKKACLAAALLLPAVAAIHGIVLAILHTDAAVDMDIYGAFQLCAIGILAAPVTVKLSKTYFNDRGRNIIFAWTGLILAGLLSLTVEFYRTNSVPCSQDANGNPLTQSNPAGFPYGNFTCGLTCDIGPGNPWSPMRSWYGSTNNIYVIPAPHILTFGTCTLLAAACCLPAILSLITMWNRIAEFNWRQRFFPKNDPDSDLTIIEGTNGATNGQMRGMQENIKKYLKIAVEIPLFGAAVMAILILGEQNFWSEPVNYQTEPIASIGQWGPIVGTGLAALGSLYFFLARAADGDDSSQYSQDKPPPCQHCILQHQYQLSQARGRQHDSSESLPGVSLHETLTATITNRSHVTDAGNRRKFAAVLDRMGDYIGTPSKKRFDVSDFKRGPAMDYPEIPGEGNRNRALSQIRRDWPSPSIRDDQSRSGSPDSRHRDDENSAGEGKSPPQSPQSTQSFHFPAAPQPTVRSNTMPVQRAHPQPLGESSSSTGDIRGRSRRRRDTLEVPSPTHQSTHVRNTPSSTSIPTIALPAANDLPSIVVSQEPESRAS